MPVLEPIFVHPAAWIYGDKGVSGWLCPRLRLDGGGGEAHSARENVFLIAD